MRSRLKRCLPDFTGLAGAINSRPDSQTVWAKRFGPKTMNYKAGETNHRVWTAPKSNYEWMPSLYALGRLRCLNHRQLAIYSA